jgi:formylglycine-generating enzyme required for sulfatase activity
MGRWKGGLATLLLAAASIAGLIVWLLRFSSSDDAGRFERGETQLIISNVAGVPCTLFRAGGTLQQSSPLREFDGTSIWLPPGSYFLQTAGRPEPSFFPIPLTGYHSGPDEEGAFLLVIRDAPPEAPPPLLHDLPPFGLVTSGTFLLGDRHNPREPHNVWLPAYFLARFEVTNEEFHQFFDAPDGYEEAANWTEEGKNWKAAGTGRSSALLTPGDNDYARFGQADQPVTHVTWFEAQAFCRWLTRTRGRGRWEYVLPSEAEWEKAARGPDGFDYSLGNAISDDQTGLYNWKKNPWALETIVGWRSTPGRFEPNRYGFYHLTGNVLEWTLSLHEPYNRDHPYAEDSRNRIASPDQRVARGGSWYSASIAYLSIAYRDAFLPGHSSQELGFRVAVHPLP